MELNTLNGKNNRSYSREDETDSSSYLLSNSNSTSTFASLNRGPAKPRRARQYDTNRGSKIYVKKNRLSRYNNALHSILPIRLTNASDGEMPIDSVGCFSNSSFWWTRRFFKKVQTEEELTVPAGLTCDGADVNGKRLAGKFKDQLQNHGSEKCSIIGCVLRFCSTRLAISTVIHIFAIIFELLGLTLFLRLFLSTIPHKEPVRLEDVTDDVITIPIDPNELKIVSVVGFALCIFISNYLKSMTSWINLRTAIRLRNAILGALFKKCLKTKISYNIAVHQLMPFAGADGERVLQLIEKSFLVPGIFIGVTLASVASIILLGFPGIWPLFVIFPILLVVIVLAKISSKYLSMSAHYAVSKLTVVEELCVNFRNTVMLDFTKVFAKDFMLALHMQNRMASYRDIFSTHTSGHVTSAILIGGLYLNWCDVGIRTDTVEVLTLIVLFSYLIKGYIVQFCHGIQAVTDAQEYMDKVKESFIHDPVDQTKIRPKKEFYVAADNALFTWSDDSLNLKIEQMYIPKGNIEGLVGLTGSGKTTFVHSLLGQTTLKGGDFRLKGKIEYYPEEPFILHGSIKDNIVMNAVFDGTRFFNAILETKLNDDILVTPGIEDCDIMTLDLEPQQIHRIILARALYSESSAFVFDEPLRNIRKSFALVQLFQQVMFRLQIQEKTVIIVSCYRPFLEICQKLHYIQNGTIVDDTGTRGTYGSFVEMPEYDDVLYREDELESSGGHQERIAGANMNGLALQKPPNSRKFYDDTSKIRWTPMSYLRILTIVVFLTVTNIGYFGLPFTFIQFSSYKDPWLAYICIGIIISSIFFDVLVKALYATSCEIKSNKYQTALMEKLLKTSLNYLQTTPISDIMDMFMMEFNEDCGAFVTMLNSCVAIVFSASILIWSNYWLACVVVPVVLVVVLDYFKFRSVLDYFINCETLSKGHIFQIGTNLLRGRAVIQSVCAERSSHDFLKKLYSSIECNTTAIYIQKALTYYSAFLLQFFLCCIFISVITILGFTGGFNDSQDSIFFFTMGIFAYFTFAYHIQQLVESLLYLERYKIKYHKMKENLASIPKIEIESIGKKQIISLYRGIPIEMRNVDVKISVRNLLKMKEAVAQPGEKISIIGDGGHLVPALLARVVAQSRGEVNLGQLPILAYTSDSNFLFGFIPHDPYISAATISMFLDPNGTHAKMIPQALKLAKIWEFVRKLPKVMDEPVIHLSRFRRQQLCLARCFVRRAIFENPVIVIEYPHPDLIPTLRQCLNHDLANNTVIILASHEAQIVRADVVYETEE